MPRSSAGPGTITQWLFICRCDAERIAFDDSASKICNNCGKPLSEGRKGTFTQFIFRAETCSCVRPVAPPELYESMTARESLGHSSTQKSVEDEAASEVALPLDEDSFPLSRYKPLKELGSGSSGRVYLARDMMLNKLVAVKTLQQLTGEQLISFQEEAKATSLLNHKNIVKILDFGAIESGIPYMVLEYIPGLSLFKQLERHRGLPWQTTVDIFIEICRALDYAHKEGVMHRDVKPSNIIFHTADDGEIVVKLIDFGVAQVGALGERELEMQGRTIVGTPHYMSPDQARGQTFTSQSDIYSLGCVMFECLAGSPPFSADSPLELLRLHAEAKVPSAKARADQDLPADLDRLIARCLEKDPDRRPASMAEILEELQSIKAAAFQAVIEKSDFDGQSSSINEPAQRRRPRFSKFSIMTGLIVIVAVAAGTAFLYLNNSFRSEKATEKPEAKKTPAVIGAELESFRQGPELSAGDTFLMHHFAEVSGKDLKKLDLTKVQIVQFDFCSIEDDEVMRVLARCPNLNRLLLPGARNMTKERLETFVTEYNTIKDRVLPIRTIDLNSSDIAPGTCKYLEKLPTLRVCLLDKTAISDQDMLSLSKLPLEQLTIEQTKITDRGLGYLERIKSLRLLRCENNAMVSQAAIEKFKKANPRCMVKSWKDSREKRSYDIPGMNTGF